MVQTFTLRASQTAMRLLHPDIKIAIMSRALYSEEEEKIVCKVLSVSWFLIWFNI